MREDFIVDTKTAAIHQQTQRPPWK